jgi:cellulose biosynthesis protein BcsQ
MNSPVRFDDSLPAFARLVATAWGNAAITENLFLRDASGRLTFIVIDGEHDGEQRRALGLKAAGELGGYVDGLAFAVATPEELFDDSLKDINQSLKIHVTHDLFNGEVRLVDRRMVGVDWLRKPVLSAPAPARLVFASLKGGVGRSTALSVLAAHLSSKGQRVLAVDMDLEAPGLGNLLLPEGTLPRFGLLDYLVEAELGNTLDDGFFHDLTGPSWLGQGRGRVDVIPAIGQRSLQYPANVLAKLARAYLAGSGSNGQLYTFADQMRLILDRFADPLNYDVVLVDCRAGLHETTAAGIVALGAEVLLFGLDQPQTFTGFELLFAHLSDLPTDAEGFWQDQLHIVHSKAPRDARRRAKFAERISTLLETYLWPRQEITDLATHPSELSDTFEVEWAEESSGAVESLLRAERPSPIVSILDDDQFRSFDPLADRDMLADRYYSLAFGELIEMAEAVVSSYSDSPSRDAQ